ncbi:hypothetical protein H8356DRAFT_957743 [Neocallimastix lanati (nom. inval.)]|nr:hypothetical protein H8356DRAFT_957743 [Neocallimastix sp. JGI-2020a]
MLHYFHLLKLKLPLLMNKMGKILIFIFKKVEFKTGGNWSRSNDRVGFNLKLNKNDRLFNTKNIKLRPDTTDFTSMRTKIAMELLYKWNLPSPHSTYIELYINDKYFGLYYLEDGVKPNWIKNMYELPKDEEITTLFNCKKDGALMNLETANHCFNSNDDYANYTQPIDEAFGAIEKATSIEDLKKVINIDQFIKNIAIEFLFGSYDHFIVHAHNYLLYKKADGIWDMILVDFDNELGNGLLSSWSFVLNRTADDITKIKLEEMPKEESNIFNVAILKDQTLFKKALHELLVTGFNPDFIFPRIEEIKKLITPYVEKSITPNEDGSYPGVINLIGSPSVHTLKDFEDSFTSEDQMKIGLKTWIQKRFEFACETYGFDKDEILKEAAEYRKTGVFKSNENTNIGPQEKPKDVEDDKCWSKALGYECCDSCNVVFIDDKKQKWGSMNKQWCGIDKVKCANEILDCPKTAYPCCSHCNVSISEEYIRWGIENGDWCMINFSC